MKYIHTKKTKEEKEKEKGREAMEVERNNGHQLQQLLHMNGGDKGNSYANNSAIQKNVILKTKHILRESIKEMCEKKMPDCLTMVDMGCSAGPNTLLPTLDIIDAIDQECHRLHKKTPILQIFLNDLPGNDFNFIIRSLPSFYQKIQQEKGSQFRSCFVAAMPGTFFGRLFPPQSLHFVHSSYSIHWLSEVPKIPENKGHVHLTKTSPPAVLKAYLDQFQRDFKTFLRARSEEVVPQGQMVLTALGRDDNICFSNKYSPGDGFEFLSIVINDMISEGLIEESKVDTLNIPYYPPSAEEVKKVIEDEGSFKIIKLESVNSCMEDVFKEMTDKYKRGKFVADHVRAIAESMLEEHLGHEIIDYIFQRLSIKLANYLAISSRFPFTNIVFSLIKE